MARQFTYVGGGLLMGAGRMPPRSAPGAESFCDRRGRRKIGDDLIIRFPGAALEDSLTPGYGLMAPTGRKILRGSAYCGRKGSWQDAPPRSGPGADWIFTGLVAWTWARAREILRKDR
jgi:hypothetical protein